MLHDSARSLGARRSCSCLGESRSTRTQTAPARAPLQTPNGPIPRPIHVQLQPSSRRARLPFVWTSGAAPTLPPRAQTARCSRTRMACLLQNVARLCAASAPCRSAVILASKCRFHSRLCLPGASAQCERTTLIHTRLARPVRTSRGRLVRFWTSPQALRVTCDLARRSLASDKRDFYSRSWLYAAVEYSACRKASTCRFPAGSRAMLQDQRATPVSLIMYASHHRL